MTFVVPVFASVITCEAVAPVAAVTETLLGVADRVGKGSANPAQPDTQLETTKIAIRLARAVNLLLRIDFILLRSPIP
jgi:hypothetical protein